MNIKASPLEHATGFLLIRPAPLLEKERDPYTLKKNIDFEPKFRFQSLETIVNLR